MLDNAQRMQIQVLTQLRRIEFTLAAARRSHDRRASSVEPGATRGRQRVRACPVPVEGFIGATLVDKDSIGQDDSVKLSAVGDVAALERGLKTCGGRTRG